MHNDYFHIEELKEIAGLKRISYTAHSDHRGNIYTTFKKDKMESICGSFDHDKFSHSTKNVIRGFHADKKSTKIVTCVYGLILQVFCDYRLNSETYLSIYSRVISHSNLISFYVPVGVLNAYYVMSDTAVYHYKYSYMGEYADVQDQITVAWNSPKINFVWPTSDPILSERDTK
jgi:dTDP-4-dehydrorhamnose 3,5-epimerase